MNKPAISLWVRGSTGFPLVPGAILPKDIMDGVEVQIVREDEVAWRQRFDIRVTAPCQGTRRLLTAVIEVKPVLS